MGSKKKEILEEMNHFDDDIDAYMGNDDILEYLPKSAELDEPDLFKLSGEGDIDENDRLPDLPKFLNKNNNIPLDSTMTTDHTLDNNEQEFDEDELIIIKDLEKKSQQKDRKERERYEAKNPDEYEPEQEEEHNDYHDDPDHNDDEEEELAEPKPSAERDIPQNKKDKDKQATNTKGKTGDSQNSLSSTARLYQHEVAKPKFNAGKKQISISEAKLFGLLDEKGEFIDLKSTQKVLTADEKFQLKRYYNEMSAPKPESTEEELNTEELTFKPMKSQDALKAMKNPHCGYDFMDRLNTRGNFLDRVNQLAGGGGGGGKNGKESKISKTEYDRMKQDYDSLLNKLQCPKCLKFQSFDEFINKKRLCTLCNQKFTKLHLSSGLSFTKKNEEYERKRLEKLEKIDREMYGNIPPKTMKPSAAAANHSNTASLLNNPRINETQSALPNHPRPVSASNAHNKTQTINKSSNKPQNNLFPNKTTLITPAALSKANNNNNTQQQQPAAESKIDQRDAIKKIMAINNQNAMKAFETLQRFETPAEEKGSASRGADKKKSLTPRPTSAAATSKNKMAKDMERLLNP